MKIFKIIIVLGVLTLFASCSMSNERIEPVNHNHQVNGGEYDDPVQPGDPD